MSIYQDFELSEWEVSEIIQRYQNNFKVSQTTHLNLKFDNDNRNEVPQNKGEIVQSLFRFVFQYKNFECNEEQQQKYFDDCKEVTEISKSMVEHLDLISENMYFDSELKFKQFIKFCDKHIIPVECYWSSNLNGPAIRCRLPSLSHNQQKCKDADKMRRDLTDSEPLFKLNKENIQIDTIEQLKLLHAVSVDLEKVFFTGPKRCYDDITEYLTKENKKGVVNMNMFINHYICKVVFDEQPTRTNVNEIFNNQYCCFCAEHPDDIQLRLRKETKELTIKIAKNNKPQNGRVSIACYDRNKYGIERLQNINSNTIKNYIHKLLNLYLDKPEIKDSWKDDMKLKHIDEVVKYLLDLLYPILCFLVNKLFTFYKSPGYLFGDCNTRTPFKDIVASLCTDKKLQTIISEREISLPGYDTKIPKIVLEYRKGTYDEKLKKYVEENIDSFEVFPCLNEFKEFLSLKIFSKDHFDIDELNNSFTLRNCWMIQGLGTLKLFSDIDQNKVHEDFEFTQFKGLEEADDKGKFYERIQKESEEKKTTKKLFKKFLNELIGPLETLKEQLENDEKCKIYKLKNLSTFIAYNAIKYFYHIICAKGKDQPGFDVCNYELEEVEKGLNYRSDIDPTHKITHSRSFVEVLFSIAESYNYKYCDTLEKNMLIICRRLKLKSEIEDDNIINSKIKSKFFLPAFLPVFALIPDPFKEVFEDIYKNNQNIIFDCASGILNANLNYYVKEIKLIAILENISGSITDKLKESLKEVSISENTTL